ncbi:MAG: hypothetical protein ACREQV_10485, partial [Candidatus Binatia bacterium]
HKITCASAMTSKTATMNLAAARYLDKWILEEKPIYVALLATIPASQRIALGRAVTYFRVVRNLRRSSEEKLGVPRFEPLRQCLDAITREDVSNERFVATTIALARMIASQYGGKNYISLASKLLWMRFRHPVVIYDSRVQTALCTPVGDYHAYVKSWHECYTVKETAIRSACESLTGSLPTLKCGTTITEDQVRQIADQEWFRRRVMDMFIWMRAA